MNPDHARFAEWDSAYVLGALSPAERREYEEHLESCDLCRRSVAELTPIPGLLARLTPERAAAVLDEPAVAGQALRPELLEAVRTGGPPSPHPPHARSARDGCGGRRRGGHGGPRAPCVPAAGGRRADRRIRSGGGCPGLATATLTSVGWGTRIELDCRYGDVGASDAPDDGWPYALYVVDRDGNRSEVSSWRANPGKTARLAAATAVEIDDIASLEVRALGSGDVLLLGDAD